MPGEIFNRSKDFVAFALAAGRHLRLPAAARPRVTQGAREHGDAGDQAASGNSSTSISGYQRLNTVLNSRLSVLTRVCNSRCAPRLLHCICCFLQKRLLTTWFTVDSTKPVAIASPLRYR